MGDKMTRVTISKRFLLLFMVAWITFISVFSAYQKTTYCAEWIAGAISAVAGGPLLTALLVGGVVVAGGIAVHEIMETDTDDYRNFYNGIKTGFNDFIAEQEKQIALEQDSSLSDQQASDIGVAVARDTVNSFFSNTIDNVKGTTKSVTAKAYEYWDLYSRIIGNVADFGIPDVPDITITPTTIINANVNNLSTYNITSQTHENVGSSCFEVSRIYYVRTGQVCSMYENGQSSTSSYVPPNTDSSRIRIPFCIVYSNGSWGCFNRVCYIDYNALSHAFIAIGVSSTYTCFPNANTGIEATMNGMIGLNSFPTFVVNSENDITNVSALLNDYDNAKRLLGIGNAVDVPSWKRTINDTLDNTHIGKSIQTGRRQLVNTGDYIGSIFVEDSIPIKKKGLLVNDGVATGQIGWDIPASDTWDDYLAGNIPFPDVVGDTGTIVVPKGNVTDYPTDDSVEIPADSTVTDSRPDVDNPDEPNGETTPEDVNQEQGGSYYPSSFDLTNIFPFCIPYDLIYLVEKFDVHGEQAPVITIPIMYPEQLQGALGTDRYNVVIDFADYLVLRNIIRVFLLLGFVLGLIKLTREIIRG